MGRPDAASTPQGASGSAILVRLGMGLLLALAVGLVAGYYNTQRSSAAQPVSLMVVETVSDAAVASAVTSLPRPTLDEKSRLDQALVEDSLAIIRTEMQPRVSPNELQEMQAELMQREEKVSHAAVVMAPPLVAPVVAAIAPVPPVSPAPLVVVPVPHTFNSRPLRLARTVQMLVTAYSPDAQSCGDSADNITASGYSVWTNGMKMVAADTKVLPFGSVITVPGYNHDRPVPVLDRGGKIKGNHIDLLFPTHESALKWGKRYVDIQVWEYAD